MTARKGVMHRCWINQPSSIQRYNNLHGKNVLCDFTSYPDSSKLKVIVYFVDGDIISQVIDRNALTMGWL